MKRLLTILLTAGLWLYALADGFTLTSHHVTTADGLSGNTINELAQDEEGFIWMATNNGLSRYDGYSTVNYTSLSTDKEHRMEARVGRIFCDNSRNLLWLSTATYQNACYDLRHARFIDWSGRGNHYRQQNKVKLTTRGMVLYGANTGATLCGMTDGQPWAVDYQTSQKALPSDNVLSIVEDSAHHIWLPTDKGIAVLPANSKQSTIINAHAGNIIAAATSGQVTYFLNQQGGVYAYDTKLKKVLNTQIPAILGRPSKVNTSFVWQGHWLLFTPEATYAMNLKNGTFEKPTEWQLVDGLDQGRCEGYHFIANRTGRLWLFPDSGSVKTFDLLPEAYYITNKGWKYHVARATDGRLFIATYGNGLFVYTPEVREYGGAGAREYEGAEALQHYSAHDKSPLIHSDYLLCAITDRQGNIWIGSESAGAYCIMPTNHQKAIYLQPQPDSPSNWDNSISVVRHMSQDGQGKHGDIIFGTRKGNVYSYNAANRKMALVASCKASITAYFTDSKGRTWIGTWGDGLYIDGQRYTTTDSLHHIPSNIISDILEDRQGRIWVATWNAGLLLMGEQGVKQYLNTDINGCRINDLLLDKDGTLWVASNNGVVRLKGDKPETYNTTNKTFPSDEVRALLFDHQGTLWAACAGAGVVRCQIAADGTINTQKVITKQIGLANNSATSMVEDKKGYIWVGTEDGMSRINPNNNIVNSYHFASIPQGNACFNNSAASTGVRGHGGTGVRKSEGKEILFGTMDGLLVINPDAFSILPPPSTLLLNTRITDINVNGVSIHEMGLLEEAMGYTSRITLAHDQNSLRIYFSDFEYDRQSQRVFQYYLEDVDRHWQGITPENHADYSDLQPGHYTFHLRSLNAEGEWNNEVTLQIVIRQPWWNTWWAWLIYILLLGLIAWYLYRNGRERFLLHQQIKMERQLTEFRTNLFTNITHEFRTPLAIIKGAVDKLSQDSSSRAALQTAQRGTKRLLRLVNQFMEYRKINTGNLRLKVAKDDLVRFVQDLTQDFWTVAQQKDINLTFLPSEKKLEIPFDHQMVETIVYNLLSNAVKYTPERGSITVRLKSPTPAPPHPRTPESASLLPPPSTLLLQIEDSGPGISVEQQKELFKPFMHGYVSQGGMGIGLYTAYQMAQAHKGTLGYERIHEEGGSRFTLTLPADDTVYTAEDYLETGKAIDTQRATDEVIKELQGEALNDRLVVIIEDNPDMMDQIRQEVGVYFNTIGYSTGQAFLDSLLPPPCSNEIPSLILCDVMLPDISGYDIVSKVKAHGEMSSVPVIMLTALDDDTHQIRAYHAGAADYMVKPVNFNLLLARMMQLIKWNEAQPASSNNPSNHSPSSLLPPPSSTPILETQADKLFKDRMLLYINKHISDSSFSVDRLAELMNMGRTKFYGKVKELTGMSPNKYLMDIRMKKAADLLADGELTVAEVSYKVGFEDPSYFNKCFKAAYGVVPSKYVRSAE